jgi:hypothetical protein
MVFSQGKNLQREEMHFIKSILEFDTRSVDHFSIKQAVEQNIAAELTQARLYRVHCPAAEGFQPCSNQYRRTGARNTQ